MEKRKKHLMDKIGFTCSCFDLLHVGHILMLKDAKEQCDKLIIGLQTDPTLDRPEKNKPIQSQKERYIQLEAVKYVDDIFVYDTEASLLDLLKLVKPDVRILGSDYEGKSFTGDNLNIPIYYHKRNHNYSSSNLRKEIIKKA
jgi:glycerol-3-phosphate cytidylyltransferase